MSFFNIKKYVFLLLCIFCFLSNITIAQDYAFSMRKHGGRFGNCIYLYALTVYLSEKYKKPFVYRPFQYSDKLLLHTKIDSKFATYKRVGLRNEASIFSDLQKNNENILFLCSCKTTLKMSPEHLSSCHSDERKIDMIAQNPKVLSLLRTHIQLINPLPKINNYGLPSIALHIRTGGNFKDDENLILKQKKLLTNIAYQETNSGYLLKFVQFIGYQFYFRAIKLILKQLNYSRCYIYLFTDDNDPEKILNIFKEKFKNESIIFDCKRFNGHDFNVIEDFFMMMQFDYLIRSFSTYTQMAQILGKYKKVIYPANGIIKNGVFNVQKINIVDSRSTPRIIQINFDHLP